MEEIPCSKRRKIEETVLNILKNADFETATEYSVRATASQQLCIDLSDLASKICVRQVLESFLLSTAAPIQTTTSDDAGNDKVSVPEETKHAEVGEEQQDKETKLSNGNVDSTENNGRVICKLSDKRNVAIHDLGKGQTLVSIRDYYQKDGKQFPSGRDTRKRCTSLALCLMDFSPYCDPKLCKSYTTIKFSQLTDTLSQRCIHCFSIICSTSFPWQRPSGITLTGRQWACLRNSFSVIEEAIARMQSKLMRSVAVDDITLQGSAAIVQNQLHADIPNPVNGIDTQSYTIGKRKYERLSSIDPPTIPSSAHQSAVERLQPQTDICPSLSAASPQGHVQHNQLPSSLQGLVPIMTTRLNGKNYHCWMHQMEFFLRQLNVAYVLMNSCPSIPGEGASLEENTQAEVAAKKWEDDEYICRHSILNSLCDNLFEEYSKKSFHAKELWEELKSVYSEDFGTVRSEVNKYIQFQMVDGVSVLEQVQELNYIANAITSSGIWIDENLHVSVIISKLPPSWKEYRAKLMYHEFLPLNMLVHLLKVEEESRNQRKKENPSKIAQVADAKVENRFEVKKKEGKRVCYHCSREGHISKYCPDRKLDPYEKSIGKTERAMTLPRESREVQTNTLRRTADS